VASREAPVVHAISFMHEFPHHYTVTAAGAPDGHVILTSDGIPGLATAAPAEFDGPGDRWSPETLLTGAIADCFILTFRGVSRAMKISWDSLVCKVDGTLDRVDRTTQFTSFTLRVTLSVKAGTDEEAAKRALERAEQACLITNSLKAPVHLDARVTWPIGALA
jgi:organic hydroperoxide reductase OsmC/OhrA